jgi:hypothetical protein
MENKSSKMDFLATQMNQNFINENVGNNSTEIAQYAPLVLPLVQKIYPQSLVAQIASVQPINSPVGRVAALYSVYSGDGSNNSNGLHVDAGPTWTNSKIITVDASAGALINVGSTGASGTNTITVFYKENVSAGPIVAAPGTGAGATLVVTNLLVRVDGGSIVTGNTFTINGQAGIVVRYASANRNIIKRIFSDYALGIEGNTAMNSVNFEIRSAAVATKTRRIKSTFTQEKLQEIKSIYTDKADDFVASYVANEIQQEIDREIIEYLKDISTPMPADVNLTKSFANAQSGSIGDMTYDLYFTIFSAIEEIVRATKRNRTMFIMADSATIALLVSNALHAEVEPSKSNPYLVGHIGAYPLFADPYSTEHYMIIGYRYESDSKDDSGLIFCPYTSTIVEAVDPQTFEKLFMTINRYGYIRHPQDAGTGNGDSDFFRYVAVDFGNTTTLGTPTGGGNLTNQIRTNF